MQTTQQQTHDRIAPNEHPELQRTHHGPKTALNMLLFATIFAAFGWFVSTLENINFDTLFIALFCTSLSMFVIKAFSMAFSRERHSG